MTHQFHRNLNRMALFTALLAIFLILFRIEFMRLAISNLYLNGVILGVTSFGVGLCFIEMFKLLPEYRWLQNFINGNRHIALPPYVLRSVAMMLNKRPHQISASALNNMLDMVIMRFEDTRESIRYITNLLIFLGLLGTFWGLIVTVGSFADLLMHLNMSDESVLLALQHGLARPLSGMGTAFTSSLLGLGGSLTIGFLGMQVQLAQNSIFNELEEFFATHTHPAISEFVVQPTDESDILNIKSKPYNNKKH